MVFGEETRMRSNKSKLITYENISSEDQKLSYSSSKIKLLKDINKK